jgi:hypothetical protein
LFHVKKWVGCSWHKLNGLVGISDLAFRTRRSGAAGKQGAALSAWQWWPLAPELGSGLPQPIGRGELKSDNGVIFGERSFDALCRRR